MSRAERLQQQEQPSRRRGEMISRQCLFSILLIYASATIADGGILRHDLFIRFDAVTGAFAAVDRVGVSDEKRTALPDLAIDAELAVERLAFDERRVDPGRHVTRGRIDVPPGTSSMRIEYTGRVESGRWPYLVWFPGDGWYPDTVGWRHSFRLEVVLPEQFAALTQGVPATAEVAGARAWNQDKPQQGVYLVAGPWHEYARDEDGRHASVLLLKDDAPLASRYLDAAHHWLARYADALGEYPYHAFTLVENRRQTGWGMPAFTLIGSRVIRLPFIVYTSFPHEIVHSWWGNGVFVDDSRGNWSEPLATYLADHLVRETQGAGRRYRLDTLVGWHDFARRGRDFPLSAFTGRHDEATQSVGYGKGMFVFHMLRRRLGDGVFMDALRGFYAKYRFRRADFDDLRESFEVACGCHLDAFFSQWLERTGAPRIELSRAEHDGGRTGLRVVLAQTGEDEPWRLRVPLRVTHADGSATWHDVELAAHRGEFVLPLDAPAARVEVDPDFDVFRQLGPDERPLTFGRVFGAERVAIVAATPAYAEAARTVASAREGWHVADRDAGSDADAVVVLGRDLSGVLPWKGVSAGRFRVDGARVELGGQVHVLDADTTVALVDEMAGVDRSRTLMWVGAAPGAAARTVERLAHYGRRSFVVFEGGGNVAARTGQWATRAASLSREFEGAGIEPTANPPRPLF